MISITDREKFQNCIIAQDDTNDYDESGYVAVVDGDFAAISRYGHCSCYGTWTAICGGGICSSGDTGTPEWDWTGTVAELLDMAERCADPAMPARTANSEDCDYGYLVNVYSQIKDWAKKRSAPPVANPVLPSGAEMPAFRVTYRHSQNSTREMERITHIFAPTFLEAAVQAERGCDLCEFVLAIHQTGIEATLDYEP
jgi:hypothetical protein